MSDRIKEIREEEGMTVVVPQGEIDLSCAPSLFQELDRICRQKPACLVIDLAEVSYLDSSGVSMLIELFRAVHAYQGNFVLVSPQPRVRSMFEIAKLDKFFKIVNSIEEARP